MDAGLATVGIRQMWTFRLSRWSSPSTPLAYGVTILSVTAALAIALLLEAFVQSAPTVSLFLCAIMFVAWFGGLGPSLLAVAVAAACFTWFIAAPGGSIDVGAKDGPRIALFVITSLFVG